MSGHCTNGGREINAKIQNLQQIEAAVGGPESANRLLTVNGQFDVAINAVGAAKTLGRIPAFLVY